LEILQKQRLEFEDLLAKRIREREHEIVKAANEAIQAKDQAVEGLLDAAIKTQKQEHDAEMENLKNHLQLELSTKYEVSMESKLAAQKEQFVKELSEKVREIEHLKERMDNLQRNLESSRDFEYTSQKAHRVSAAALALMEKMESGHSAVEQYAILKVSLLSLGYYGVLFLERFLIRSLFFCIGTMVQEAASENEVIGSVLSQIPSTIKTGIPTLPELQASFENVHKAGRQVRCAVCSRS
jgi:vacuolar-type H+-ATPase subunit I/STV1